MFNLTDKLMELDEETVANLYKQTFSSVEAQLVLEDLKNRSFVKTALPYGQEGDRAEGMRQVVLHVESQLNYKPEDPTKEESDA